jgi:hypothetical protein
MPYQEDTTSRPRRRRRPLHSVLAIVLSVLLLPVVAFMVWSRIEAARLDRALDALEAREEPLDIAEFEPKPATGEQREASHAYAQAMKVVGDQPMTSSETVAATKAIEQLCTSPADSSRSEPVRVLRAIEDSFAPAFDALDRATRLDAAGWDEGDRPRRMSMEEMRPVKLARLNAIRIARLACTGHGDDAGDALLATLRLGRMIPLAFFSGNAVRSAHSLHVLLTFTSPDPLLLQKIQAQYETAADDQALEKRLRFQRAQWLYFMLPGVVSDLPPGFTEARMSPLAGILMRLTRPMRDHRTVAELREFDDALAAVKEPWPGRLGAATAVTEKYRFIQSQSRRPGIVERMTRPFASHVAGVSLEGAVMNVAESLARVRASVGAVAVARYSRGHDGALPASLADLVPDYLSGPLIDPYSGKELKYRYDGRTYRVYSVGINRQDEGGRWDRSSDLQESRRGNPPDIGIAVGNR